MLASTGPIRAPTSSASSSKVAFDAHRLELLPGRRAGSRLGPAVVDGQVARLPRGVANSTLKR